MAYRDNLTKCAEAIEADPSPGNQLEATIELVRALIGLSELLPLPDQGMDSLDVAPLQRLLEAFVDIEQGHTVEFLDPARSKSKFRQRPNGFIEKKPGRPNSRIEATRMRAMGVAFVRLLILLKMAPAQAARLVAARFTEADLRGHQNGEITKTTVQTWLRKVGDGSRPGEQNLAQAYEDLLRRKLPYPLTIDYVEAELSSQAQVLGTR